jgi:hypothetical protein
MSDALPQARPSVESSLGPPPRPLPPSADGTPFSDWDLTPSHSLFATPAPRSQSQLSQTPGSRVPLKDADLLVLAKLALQHWSIRERNCGEFFEVVEKDFQKAINRNFATSRKKVQDLIKKYRGIFKEEGSGTGVNSSKDEIVPVMRELVACSDAKIVYNKKKDKQALARAQDKANAVKDRNEMLLRAIDKQRPAYLSGLESDDDKEADQTSIKEDPTPSSPSIVS